MCAQIVGEEVDSRQAANFFASILQASTQHSIISAGLDGAIQLWNTGSHLLYGYTAEEVVGKANIALLHTIAEAKLTWPGEMIAVALADGKWEGGSHRCEKTAEPLSRLSC